MFYRAVDNFYSLGGGGGGGGHNTSLCNCGLINLPCTYKLTYSHSSSQLDLNHITRPIHSLNCGLQAGYMY